LLAWWMSRRQVPERTQRRLVFAVAGSYMALFLLLLFQALRGQSIARPDGLSLESFALWLVLTAIAVFIWKPRKTIHDC
jgi:hypothetical protein